MPPVEHLPIKSAASAVSWTEFDPDWYRDAYEAVVGGGLGSDAEAREFYLKRGQGLGHSPNPFFDEIWYLRVNPDVAAKVKAGAVQSGFDHYYRQDGGDRKPHWLFDPAFYREQSPDFTPERFRKDGFVNAYDHFLRFGDMEGLASSLYFSPEFYRSELDVRERRKADAEGAYRHYLRRLRISLPEMQLSPYFDPLWYLLRYPEISAAVSRGEWRSALDHYLNNSTPTLFDPVPAFSEAYYLDRNQDVAQAIDSGGGLRSGYHHFLLHGVYEHRRFNPRIDLRYYVEAHPTVRRDLERNRSPNAFAHLLTIGAARGLPTLSSAENGLPEEGQAKSMFRQEAANLSVLHCRKPIDFSYSGVPRLSVLMVLYNQFALSLASLSSLRENFQGAIEVIIVDSGSKDHVVYLDRFVRGAKLIRFKTNVGFVEACNAGLAEAHADAILYLNNDIRLEAGAIGAALDRLASAPDIGAVGGKVIRSHGLLQEAGGIVWQDGFTAGYLRDASPLAPEANFVRDVDYCSGVFLMAPAALVKSLNGFDTAYIPAYYEDTDLCLRIIQAGYRVVYDPAVCLHHLEYGSSASTSAAEMQIARNRSIFANKHKEWLEGQFVKSPDAVVRARSRTPSRGRVLYLEDTVPLRFMGSGYVRSNDIVAMLAEMSLEMTVFPLNAHAFEPAAIYADFPDTVEVMHDLDAGELGSFLNGRKGYYDIVWVGRTHNLHRVKDILTGARTDSQFRIILDTECIAATRQEQQAALSNASLPFDLDRAMREEFEDADLCDAIIAVNDQEADLLRALGLGPVSVLGHAREVRLTPRGFHDRHGLLFIGAMHGESSPNYDSLCWYVDNVLPLVEAELGPEAHLTIAGYADGNANLSRFAGHAGVTLLGPVADTEPLYDRFRVFIAPTRIAAGVAYKVHEAASFGLPVVASTLLRDQIGWRDGEELLSAGATDPAAFAARIVMLYRSEELWRQLRQSAANRMLSDSSRQNYRRALEEILFPSNASHRHPASASTPGARQPAYAPPV